MRQAAIDVLVTLSKVSKVHAASEAREVADLYVAPLRVRRWSWDIPRLIALVVCFAFAYSDVNVLRADAILARASDSELAEPANLARRIALRVNGALVTEQEVSGGVVTSTPKGSDEVVFQLARRFEGIPFDWRRPLSVSQVAAWRETLRYRRDSISEAPEGHLQLRTTTVSGDLHEVQLTVQTGTYRVVREALRFADGGRIEWEELARWVRPDARRPGAVAVTPVDGKELDLAELRVRLVLAENGLSLQRALQVRRKSAEVTVSGTLPSDADTARLSARLADLAHVRVSIEDGALAERDDVALPVGSRPLRRWVDRTFIEWSVRRSFVPSLLRSQTAVCQRLALLRELADRYPAPEPNIRPTLDQLIQLHYRRLRLDMDDLMQHMAVLQTLGRLPASTLTVPADWRIRAARTSIHAKQLEAHLRHVLSQDDLTPEQRQQLGMEMAVTWISLYGP